MTRREGMYYVLGELKYLIDKDRVKKDALTCKGVELKDVFGEKYVDYRIVWYAVSNEISLNRKDMHVIEITDDFNVEQIVELLLQALAFNEKNRKNEKT